MTQLHLASTPQDLADKRKALVLIAEDEPEISEILTAYLNHSGFQTAHAFDGRRALDLHLTLKPDLVLLDVLMPKLDGWMVLAEIRHRGNTPVIMLTAQDQDMDKLMGLRIGADDYIVKPFNPAEVVARTQAVLRRSIDRSHDPHHGVLRVNAFEIDIDSHEVNVQVGTQRHSLSLTVTEFRLLAQLAKAPKRVFSRAELLALCSPESDSLERTVDSHISKLRRKIEDLGVQGVPASIRGVGYRFVSPPMKIANSLSRQIIVSMSAVVLCVIALALVGSYVFYALLWMFWPPTDVEVDGWLPTSMEWAWMALITCISLAVGAVVAIKLSRRILMPLNSVAASLRRLADGDLDARATASNRSLTEVNLLVDDFNSMAKRLKRMAEEQSFWNAAIAHELRTPLTILRGRLQGLAEGVFTPDQAQFYSLLSQVEGLARLIEDLRVVGLADHGYLEMHVRNADLTKDIEADARLFEPALQASGFVLHLDLPKRPVQCDPARIRQALLAMLDNVRRHATPGDVTVSLSSQEGINRLSVADQGPGIDETFAAHVFEPFQRGESSRSRAQGGSGLGLAVVRAIALAHAGTVSCRNLDNGGTLFELSWPDQPTTL